MRGAVRNAFCVFQTQFEGALPHMYADQKNLVTCAIGKLIDASANNPTSSAPWAPALVLPWKRSDGSLASSAEATAEWQLVKSRQELTVLGGRAYRAITKLRLTDADVEAVTLETAADFESKLLRRFPEFPEWPADAQLGILSVAWPEGPLFYARFPKFSMAADRLDFGICADESKIPGTYYDARNAAHALCFNNAAAVLKDQSDCETLWWPNVYVGGGSDDNPY